MINKTCFSSRIQKIIDLTYKNYEDELKLEQVARRINLSQCYFSKIFKSEIGLPYKKYLNIFRLYKAADFMRSNTAILITDVCYDAGFKDFSNFIKNFKRYFGCTPSKFRNCDINPETCQMRKESILYNLSMFNEGISVALNIQLSSLCYIKRTKKAK